MVDENKNLVLTIVKVIPLNKKNFYYRSLFIIVVFIPGFNWIDFYRKDEYKIPSSLIMYNHLTQNWNHSINKSIHFNSNEKS